MASSSQRRHITRREWAVLGFTLSYMGFSLLAAFTAKNEEFLFYFVVMVLLIVATIVLHFRIGLHLGALWGLSAWGAAHMAGGLMPIPNSWPINGETHVLYNWWLIPGLLKYDQVVHAYGFGLVTWICWQGLAAAFTGRGARINPTVGLLVLCVAAGNGFGAANEVVEFIATITLPGTNVGGYTNTGWDLVANLVGTIIAAATIYIRGRT
jgi:hypothetical protein